MSGHGQTVHVARLSSRSLQPPRPRSQPGLKCWASPQHRGGEAQRSSKPDIPSAVRGGEATCHAARAAPHDCPALCSPPTRHVFLKHVLEAALAVVELELAVQAAVGGIPR